MVDITGSTRCGLNWVLPLEIFSECGDVLAVNNLDRRLTENSEDGYGVFIVIAHIGKVLLNGPAKCTIWEGRNQFFACRNF